jgi:hypothetical protein
LSFFHINQHLCEGKNSHHLLVSFPLHRPLSLTFAPKKNTCRGDGVSCKPQNVIAWALEFGDACNLVASNCSSWTARDGWINVLLLSSLLEIKGSQSFSGSLQASGTVENSQKSSQKITENS